MLAFNKLPPKKVTKREVFHHFVFWIVFGKVIFMDATNNLFKWFPIQAVRYECMILAIKLIHFFLSRTVACDGFFPLSFLSFFQILFSFLFITLLAVFAGYARLVAMK